MADYAPTTLADTMRAIDERGWDWRKDAKSALIVQPDGYPYLKGCARLRDHDTFAAALLASYLEALEATPAPAAPAQS